ncbi:MAG: hypothetical protein RBT81_13335, partial [Gammaproteobacteria bacterium]|nr:hypothetical protein [Gammaproteobacteria bacterium]
MQSSSLTSRKLLVSVSFFGAALLLAGVAALVHSAFAEAALLHVAAVFLELALALTLIHFYLENRERREATSALLQLILPSVADAHNAVLEKAFAVYGKDEFRSLVSLYTSNKGDPSFLKPEDRERLYAI